jgi:hypothetical protein
MSADGGKGAAGFQDDAGEPDKGRANDELVQFYCGYLIRGLE